MRYRSGSDEVEAIQWTGWTGDNRVDVANFLEGLFGVEIRSGNFTVYGNQGLIPVPVGHWIVRKPGDLSGHWTVTPERFAAEYEPA